MPNTIPAAGEAMPKTADEQTREHGLIDLEADICDLHSMAQITDYMLDDLVSGRYRDNKIVINAYEMDMLVFAWKNLSGRAHSLKDRFYDAAHGEDAQ